MNKKFILIMLLFSICLSYLLFLSGCNTSYGNGGENSASVLETDENNTSYGCSGGNPAKMFNNMSEYFDYFYKATEDRNPSLPYGCIPNGTLYTEASVDKTMYGEEFYFFVDMMERRELNIYSPVVSKDWEYEFFDLYRLGGDFGVDYLYRPVVWFNYRLNGEQINIMYSYLNGYEQMRHANTTEMGDPTSLLRYVSKQRGETEEKNIGECREFQLKDRTVEARVIFVEARQKYDIVFLYDDVCVTIWNIASHLITDDFLKDFALEKHVPPVDTYIEETNQPAETTNG